MPFFDAPAGRAYYRRWTADKPIGQVLLLHGFGEHTGHYHRLAANLNTTGLDVWGLDHLGHGLTGCRDGMFASVDELAINAAALLSKMTDRAPHLPSVVVGHSLGALTGAYLALSQPHLVRGLVMTGAPLWGLPPEADDCPDLVMATDEAYLDALATDPLAFDTAAAEPNLWRALTNAGERVLRELPSVPLPMLLINGEYDCFAAPSLAAGFANCLEDARAIKIRGGYHDIPNDSAHRHVTRLIGDAALRWCATAPSIGDN